MEYLSSSQLDALKDEIQRNRDQTKFRVYSELNPELSVHPLYSSPEYIPDFVRQSFSRLRLQSHSLKVETGRWSRIPREQRLCDRCDAGAVQDEAHVLIACTYTEPIRQRYQNLDFATTAGLLGDGNYHRNVAEYIHEVLRCLI